jgi:hypothetical protein
VIVVVVFVLGVFCVADCFGFVGLVAAGFGGFGLVGADVHVFHELVEFALAGGDFFGFALGAAAVEFGFIIALEFFAFCVYAFEEVVDALGMLSAN